MAKLYFYFSSMNAGKSTALIQTSFNYHERGMRTLLLSPAIDTRSGTGTIKSRVGLAAEARAIEGSMDLFELAAREHSKAPIDCILVDEAQFLSDDQVWQAARIVDELDIPVLCYGLRTDFQGHLFPGSGALLGIAQRVENHLPLWTQGDDEPARQRRGQARDPWPAGRDRRQRSLRPDVPPPLRRCHKAAGSGRAAARGA
jgi:thymidine kinase